MEASNGVVVMLSVSVCSDRQCGRTKGYCNRYVRRDTGYKIALSDKVVKYKGYEDADLNSSGRASIVPETQSVVYSISQEHFNSGIFDEAYQNYLLGN